MAIAPFDVRIFAQSRWPSGADNHRTRGATINASSPSAARPTRSIHCSASSPFTERTDRTLKQGWTSGTRTASYDDVSRCFQADPIPQGSLDASLSHLHDDESCPPAPFHDDVSPGDEGTSPPRTNSGQAADATDEENEISLRLPELREMLQLLRDAQAQRESSCPSSSGDARGVPHGVGRVYLVGTGPGDVELLTGLRQRRQHNSVAVVYQ